MTREERRVTNLKITETLASWPALNTALRDADAATCEALLKAELAGRRRKRFLLRIHSRLNRMRAGAERLTLKCQAEEDE